MDVSQRLSMYITSMIGIAFKHNEHEKSIILKYQYYCINKNESLEIVTKPNELVSNLQTFGSPPTKTS